LDVLCMAIIMQEGREEPRTKMNASGSVWSEKRVRFEDSKDCAVVCQSNHHLPRTRDNFVWTEPKISDPNYLCPFELINSFWDFQFCWFGYFNDSGVFGPMV
jgi:hypothetical protein